MSNWILNPLQKRLLSDYLQQPSLLHVFYWCLLLVGNIYLIKLIIQKNIHRYLNPMKIFYQNLLFLNFLKWVLQETLKKNLYNKLLMQCLLMIKKTTLSQLLCSLIYYRKKFYSFHGIFSVLFLQDVP